VTIRWRRGFIRGWTVVATLWILGSAFFALDDGRIPSLLHGCEEYRGLVQQGTGRVLGDSDVARCENVWRTIRLTLLERTFGPPIMLFLAGILIEWVRRGFSPNNSNSVLTRVWRPTDTSMPAPILPAPTAIQWIAIAGIAVVVILTALFVTGALTR
jgi:hypothetical protein